MKLNNMLIIVMPKEDTKTARPENGRIKVPLYNIPMMSDDRWNELASRKRSEATV